MKLRVALATAVLVSGRALPVSAQAIVEFPVPRPPGGSFLLRITSGPDGNLWFTEYGMSVGRITTGGTVTSFPISVEPSVDITSGPDGNLWFTVNNFFDPTMAIGRITPAGAHTRFSPQGAPYKITTGPDGALWFTRWAHGPAIGRITTSGVITDFPVPEFNVGASGIASGPDGNLWFTEEEGSRIGVMTPEGVVTLFALPPGNRRLGDITVGPDGNLWFTQELPSRIGRVTPVGAVTLFDTPTVASAPVDIVSGPDGALWFTERDGNQIGRITVGGTITEFPIPTPAARLEGITVGPDGNIWFTEASARKIGRLAVGSAPGPPLDRRILSVVGSAPGVHGSFFRTEVQLHNPGSSAASGRIVFHPSATSGSDSDVALSYLLGPGQTQTIPDLLPAISRSGLGSADVLVAAGATPIVKARVFNDAGAAGTTGFAFNTLASGDALTASRRGVLAIPADLTNFRMNVGVRTLDANVAMTLTVRDAAGAVAAVVPKFFPATYHEQQAGSVFLNGLPLPAGGSITALVESGSVIVYGATVDNRTGDPSLQIASPAP